MFEKWYGMLFGTGKQTPTGNDLLLYNKLSQMHLGLMKKEISDAKKKRNSETK